VTTTNGTHPRSPAIRTLGNGQRSYDEKARSVLLVEETGVPGKTTDQSQVTDQQDLIMLYRVYLAMSDYTNLV
jgi:hypothetical protein